jgi:CBS domain-containing protein
VVFDAIKDFERFIGKEVKPAIADLGNLAEQQRIHVQKLVYTNLVDRFDTLVDSTLLDNCREGVLVEEAAKDLTGNITEADLVRLLMHAFPGSLGTFVRAVPQNAPMFVSTNSVEAKPKSWSRPRLHHSRRLWPSPICLQVAPEVQSLSDSHSGTGPGGFMSMSPARTEAKTKLPKPPNNSRQNRRQCWVNSVDI